MSSPWLSTVEELLEEEEVVDSGGGGSEGGGAADDEDSSSFPTTGAVAEAKAAWCRAALALALAFFAGPR